MKLRWILFLLINFFSVLPAHAVRLDLETHNALINQLTEIRTHLSPKDASYLPTTLRLADLLSDRARLSDMENVDKNQSPKEATRDRTLAIELMDSVVLSLNNSQRATVKIKKAQLFQLLKREDKALQLLHDAKKTSLKNSDEFLIATDLLADYYFSRGNFVAAKEQYLQLENSSKKKLFNQYRIAWCDLSLGSEKAATNRLESVLQKQDLEPSLRKEASRDLIVFYARQNFTAKNIENIKRFSLPSDVKENMSFYKDELKRLGKRKEAAIVLMEYIKTYEDQPQSLIAKADLFESYVALNQTQKAYETLQQLLTEKCGELCPDLQLRFQRGVRFWSNQELSNPSKELLQSYLLYSKYRPFDERTLLFATKVCQDANKPDVAFNLLSEIIIEAKSPEILETSLRAQLDSSFKSRNNTHKETALKNYLARGLDAKIKKKVQIDYTQFLIDQKKLPEAEAFATQTLQQTEDPIIAEQLLIIFNKTGQTEKEKALNLKLSNGNPDSRHYRNFKTITLTQIQKKFETDSTNKNDLESLIKLAGTSKSPSEKFKILNDAFLIAIKERDFKSLKDIAISISNLAPLLTKKERALAIEKRILVADLELDFKNSLHFEKQLSGVSNPTAEFKIAIKSRLAGTPNFKLENRILVSSRFSNEQKMWILEQQILSSSKPLKLLRVYGSLIKDTETHSRLFLLALRNENFSEASSYLQKTPGIRSSFAGELISRKSKIELLSQRYKKAKSVRVQQKNLQSFSQSLKQSIGVQIEFEKVVNQHRRDPIVHSLAMGYLQDLRLILKADLERSKNNLKISENLRKQFLNKLEFEITSLDQKIIQANQQMKSLWASASVKSEFESILQKSSNPQRQAIFKQVSFWSERSIGTAKELISELLGVISDQPEDLALDYGSLKRNPFDVATAQKIAREEQKRGNYLISTFLIERNNRLEGI